MSSFNLRITGLGYLARVRKLRSKVPFWSLQIVALRGSMGHLQCTRFDCFARGPEFAAILHTLEQGFRGEREAGIPVRFALEGLQPRLHTYKNGRNAGKQEIFLNAFVTELSLADSLLPARQSAEDAIEQAQSERTAFRIGYHAGRIASALTRPLRIH